MTDTHPHPLWSSDEHDAAHSKPQHHTRTTSNATIPENTFDLTPQTEPLLYIAESESFAPREPTIQPSRSLDSYRIRTSATRSRIGQSSLWEIIVQRRLRLLRWMKCGLEALIAIWTIYNFIRYFYSYSKYTSSQGQAAALALATSSSLSLAFLGCATLLSIFKTPLSRSIPPRASHIIRKVLRPIATCLISAPAVLNIIFLCIWRNSGVSELSHKSRCYLDIDVIWSISGGQCVAPAWGAWLILALIRLAITLVVIVSYHIFSYAYGRTIRLSNARRQTSSLYESTNISRTDHILAKEAPPNRNSQSQHRPSRSTLDSNVESIHTVVPYYPASRNRAASSASSDDDHTPTTIRHPPGLGASTEENADNWGESISEQFRTVVSHLSQEVDDVINIARSSDEDDVDNAPSPTPHAESPYGFNLPPLPPSVGYNEFGQPYPPDEPLPILNGYIRRMPTIESIGSREMGSIGSTVSINREPRITGSARSTLTFDRPPTRPLSFSEVTNSGTSSRPNSFGLRAELLASLGGATELGELFDNKNRREEEDKLNPANDKIHLDISNNPSASRSTMSYYTAASGSLGPAGDGVS